MTGIGAHLRARLAHPRLHDRRQDGHGADLGPSLGESGNWKRDRFNHSFVGFVGANRPEVLIAVRIEEAVPKATKPYLDLNIESYELFRMIARAAIKDLDIKRSRDPYAGLPIPGTEAARDPLFERAMAAAKERARASGAPVGESRIGRHGAAGSDARSGADAVTGTDTAARGADVAARDAEGDAGRARDGRTRQGLDRAHQPGGSPWTPVGRPSTRPLAATGGRAPLTTTPDGGSMARHE